MAATYWPEPIIVTLAGTSSNPYVYSLTPSTEHDTGVALAMFKRAMRDHRHALGDVNELLAIIADYAFPSFGVTWELIRAIGFGTNSLCVAAAPVAIQPASGTAAAPACGDAVVALKLFPKSVLARKELRRRVLFERYAGEWLSSTHPFLASCVTAFESYQPPIATVTNVENTFLCLGYEYMAGSDLFQALKVRRRFPEAVAKQFIGELTLAVGHLHSCGVTHCAIAPEHIYLDGNGRTRLGGLHACFIDAKRAQSYQASADAGAASGSAPASKLLPHTTSADDSDTSTCSGESAGITEYRSPEMITGKQYSRMTDWWSIGILTYELCVGIPPFYSQNEKEQRTKIEKGVLRFPPFLTAECKDFIISCLNRAPASRLGYARDAADVLAHSWFTTGTGGGLNVEQLRFRTAEVARPDLPKLIPLRNRFTSHTAHKNELQSPALDSDLLDNVRIVRPDLLTPQQAASPELKPCDGSNFFRPFMAGRALTAARAGGGPYAALSIVGRSGVLTELLAIQQLPVTKPSL